MSVADIRVPLALHDLIQEVVRNGNKFQESIVKAVELAYAVSHPSKWRKSPPTVEEVKLCRRWWCRFAGSPESLRLAELDIYCADESLDFDEDTIIDASSQSDKWHPEDWGDEFMPCWPPGEQP